MINAVPQPALIWGLAGTVPYAITAAATAWTARNATIMAASGADNPSMELLHSLQSFQITYGAVILSFLGAMHWGMEFAKYGGEQVSPCFTSCLAGVSLLTSVLSRSV